MKRRPYIALQDDEVCGKAYCGCSINSDGEYYQCKLHEHAENLLRAAKRIAAIFEHGQICGPETIKMLKSVISKAEEK